MNDTIKKKFGDKSLVGKVDEFGRPLESDFELSNADAKPTTKKSPSTKKKEAVSFGAPVEEDVVSKNRKDYGIKMKRFEDFKSAMNQHFGIYIALHWDVDFRQETKKVNGKDRLIDMEHASIYLAKTMTKTSVIKNTDETKKPVIVNEFGNLHVRFQEKDIDKKKVESLSIGGFITDHNLEGKNEVDAQRALVEITKAAFLLAQHAKAVGWKEINFGRTACPLKVYALHLACKEVGLKGPKVDIDILPKNSQLGEAIALHMRGFAAEHSENIHRPIEAQDNLPIKPKADNTNNTAPALAAA